MSVYKKYIVANFAYGTGPYLRTCELAIAVNNALEERGEERFGIIMPLVYGTKQKEIMREEFRDYYKAYPGEIIFDEKLGSYLKVIFYGREKYKDYLARWIRKVDKTGAEINKYLKSAYKDRIALELHRSPRVLYNMAPAYFVSFARITRIYEQMNFSQAAISKISAIENSHRLYFTTEPGTFSYFGKGNIPPTITVAASDLAPLERGIFVTVTGIPGLERLYGEVTKIGLKIYSNDTKAVPFAEYASPHIIPQRNIAFQFARSGWSSIWLSILSGTPIVVPEWDKDDDPEIYFNNICLEKLGLGIVYRGQSLKEILKETEAFRPGIENYKNILLKEFGTLDGTKYAAERIVIDYSNFAS
jgi:hypothetical protein